MLSHMHVIAALKAQMENDLVMKLFEYHDITSICSQHDDVPLAQQTVSTQ